MEEMKFSMVADLGQSELNYSLLKGNKVKGLSSSVIYGLNASGKTNVISAIDTLRSIVLIGNIKNLKLTPNKSNISQPIEFYIEFFEKGHCIQYDICIDLIKKIILEKLTIDDDIAFIRNGSNLKVLEKYLSSYGKKYIETVNQTELFLTNDFKIIFSKEFVELIFDWFSEKLVISYPSDFTQPDGQFAYLYKDSIYTDRVAKLLAIDLSNITVGTMRFLNMFSLIVLVLENGGTLVIDEFDLSIHPMIIMSVINIFHNDDINIHKAQLIFNTHNPTFLNSNIFRKDEIKFVEHNGDNNSVLYSLSDFEIMQKNRYEDYMKNYLSGQYGAIKDIDFSSIFEEILAL